MLVLSWHSTIPVDDGRTLWLAIGVPDDSLEDFSDRLTREGGLMVVAFELEVRENDLRVVVGQQPMFIGIAATGVLRYYNFEVRYAEDIAPWGDDMSEDKVHKQAVEELGPPIKRTPPDDPRKDPSEAPQPTIDDAEEA